MKLYMRKQAPVHPYLIVYDRVCVDCILYTVSWGQVSTVGEGRDPAIC